MEGQSFDYFLVKGFKGLEYCVWNTGTPVATLAKGLVSIAGSVLGHWTLCQYTVTQHWYSCGYPS